MYKVLLVDDEPTIREGLRTLITWEDMGYRVVDTAANGKEALLKYDLHKPDLMIVDIRMPGMDGLELIQELRKAENSPHLLILSGYADFDYAKKAITHKIDGYLLKPIDEDELIEYLEKIKASIAREEQLRSSSSSGGMHNREDRIRAQLTGGNNEVSGDAVEDAGLGWHAYEVILIKLLSRGDIDSASAAQIKRTLAERIEDTGRCAVFSMEPYLGLLLKDASNDEHILKSIYKDISSACKEHNVDFIAMSGGPVPNWREIERSYSNALQLMKDRFFLDGEQIVRKREVNPSSREPDAEDTAEELVDIAALSEKLFLAVEVGNRELIEQLVEDAGKRMTGLSEEEFKTVFVQLATGVLGKLSQQHAEIQEISPRFSSGMLEMYKEYRYRDLLRHAVNIFQSLADTLEVDGTDKQIKRMIDLIHRNYHENLKLETLAEVFNYNSAYLGKLFKNATGEYFNTYLDKVRIEHAKEFLQQGIKVYQVAEKVGYANVDYFHSKFRKYVGTSPSAYRKK
ncbi:response regulator transcription factor [Paenibacillus alkalitolerans]|uniref:response regulator transcription factor n=1 Tax=Paenibacillus alkalitolerans TaxID=2799335 RepID=UPI0018F4CB7A|nr:response regulator transcription factor [Paenibacillus alkalitolerans]